MKKNRYLRPRDYTKFKRQWKLVLKNYWQLNHEKTMTNRLYAGIVTEYIMLEYLLSVSPVLSRAYRLVNKLKDALYSRWFEQFEQLLKEAKSIYYESN